MHHTSAIPETLHIGLFPIVRIGYNCVTTLTLFHLLSICTMQAPHAGAVAARQNLRPSFHEPVTTPIA